jgi:hypothetical protein
LADFHFECYPQAAKEVAKKTGKCDFEVPDWCLESFRKWKQIVLNDVYGESGDINEETIANCVAKFPSIMAGYKAKEFANGDELGLFFVVLSSKTLCLIGEKYSGGQLHKEC